MSNQSPVDLTQLAQDIKQWGQALGFQKVGISDIDLGDEEPRLQAWLDKQYHGEMAYMARHGSMRAHPEQLLPGTLRVISVRIDYLPDAAAFAETLDDPEKAYISRYAAGRDYHKLMRNRLKKLGQQIQQQVQQLGYRPFVDSAPVLERPLAAKAGLGWIGKHSLLLDEQAGSWFFLGELLVDLPLPVDQPVPDKCGKCQSCMTICPTNAIVEPYVVDARRCISYLTIEHSGSIPEELRPLMGNRIYGCDDCQLVCPWNRFANLTGESDFEFRDALTTPHLLDLFGWSEATFLKLTEGSPIRRIGYQRWQRNLAVALGNAPFSQAIIDALNAALNEADELVAEHLQWALSRQLSQHRTRPNERIHTRLISSIRKGLPRDA